MTVSDVADGVSGGEEDGGSAGHLDLEMIRGLTDVGSMTRLLHETIARERAIEAELEGLLGEREDLERKLLGLYQAGEVLELVRSDADHMLASVRGTCALAEHVSSKVRELDVAQSRVNETVAKIEAVVDRTNCIAGVKAALECNDYEEAAKFVKTFLQLDAELERGGVGGAARGGNRDGGAADTAMEQKRQLMESKKRLEEVIRQKFAAAVEERDQVGVERFAKLFSPLGLQEEGVRSLVAYLRKVVAARAREAYDVLVEGLEERLGGGGREGAGGVKGEGQQILLPADFVETLTSLFRDVALAVEGNEETLKGMAGDEAVVFAVQELQEECDVRATAIVRKYVEHRRLATLQRDIAALKGGGAASAAAAAAVVVGVGVGAGVEVPNTREVEVYLEEMLLLSKRTEEYSQFMTAKVASFSDGDGSGGMDGGGGVGGGMGMEGRGDVFRLGMELQTVMMEMRAAYVTLEEYFTAENVRKAIRIDEAVPHAMTTSMVDDVFFILQNCLRRAVSTGSVQAVVSALSAVNEVLGTDFREALARRLKEPNLAAKLFAGAGGVVAKTGSEVALALNNADVSTEYAAKLKHEIEELCSEVFPSPTDREKTKMCLNDLADTSAVLRQLTTTGLEQLANSITPRLRTILDGVTTIPYELSEEQYSENEINDPWVQRLLAAADSSVTWLQPLLTPGNYDALVHLVTEFVVKRLEALMLQKRFNQLGGLQLDRDVRALAGHFSGMTPRTVRDKFARLTQMAAVLNLEKVSEILDFWGENSGPMTWRLTPAEVRRVLGLRVDFKAEAIASLRL